MGRHSIPTCPIIEHLGSATRDASKRLEPRAVSERCLSKRKDQCSSKPQRIMPVKEFCSLSMDLQSAKFYDRQSYSLYSKFVKLGKHHLPREELTSHQVMENVDEEGRVLKRAPRVRPFLRNMTRSLAIVLLLVLLPLFIGEAHAEPEPEPEPKTKTVRQWKAVGDVIPISEDEDSYTENKPRCDRRYVSGAQKEGIFRAPDIYNPEKVSRQCLYTFIAGEGERVRLQFNRFDLRGTPPDGSTLGVTPACSHEYLDIFTEATDPNKDLLKTPFGGRYCGKISPRLRISWHKTIHIAFFTDNNITTPDLFSGTYKFINDSKYSVGVKAPDQDCGFVVNVDVKKHGEFLSPTYPGVYPKNITCYWKFVGKHDQRIRLEFRDFDLFYGGPHCPFDHVKMFDGGDTFAPLIGTYCGQQRNLVVFSSSSSVLVTFSTLYRIADTQNRGFQGIFNISDSYLRLNFINEHDAEHIRGTECDQRILSKRTSNGTVFSPNYPYLYLPNIVCRYFIYGLQDSQNLERVRLEFFDRFDIPATPKSGKNCTDGYLRVYLRGQEVRSEYDKPDHEYCGQTLPHSVVALGPRLLMVFSSGKTTGTGFKAHYKFETEYKIPGTASPDGRCVFSYLSSSQKSGTFNSPRHPSNYPSNTTCEFTFKPAHDEVVEIVFVTFKIRNDNPGTGVGVHRCQEDWMELFNIYRPRYSEKEREVLKGRYCGETAPGPTQSEREAVGLRVVLHTDHSGVYSGFDAIYIFKKKEETFGVCGGNITESESGELLSPNFPENYGAPDKTDSSYCDWYIQVRPGYKVLLWFQSFAVEGNPEERGCPAAAVRVWKHEDDIPVDMCGDALPSDQIQILSQGSVLRMTFLAAARAVGAKGFKAIWTEVLDSPQCNQFLCKSTNFCIPRSLHCDGVANCGLSDFSDEERCDKARGVSLVMLTSIVLGVSSSVTLVVCLWCQKRKLSKKKENSMAHVHAYEKGARFAAMDIGDRSVSPVIGTRKATHHLSHASLRMEGVV
ncbi:bone morphogenetic protein 1-like isoform X2 [Hyalella azteca]|uniref:Bone morphogenetic protein 1-like isoform X2 n=1 Tax=Hyalella azteca TaxID=294128 RepID=A0A979FKT9_HYAAZ|nr:bone morphogenetic protein 1-like isoform X2 [Hyalella azteca]